MLVVFRVTALAIKMFLVDLKKTTQQDRGLASTMLSIPSSWGSTFGAI